MKPTKAIHKTFERDDDGKRALTLYISDGKETHKLSGTKLITALQAVEGEIRILNPSSTDTLLQELHDRDVAIRYANWHATGFEKGMPPEEIARQLAQLSEDKFRDFIPNDKLTELRQVLSLRNANVQSVGDQKRALLQVARDRGLTNKEDILADPMLGAAYKEIETIRKAMTIEETQLDTIIDNMAKKIPECVLFNKVAHIKTRFGTAAHVMAYSGGFDRFERVSSVWHYFGQHARNGAAPRRKKGEPMDWSPILRTVMWQMGSSIIKHAGGVSKTGRALPLNPWREFFDTVRAEELAAHPNKQCYNAKTGTLGPPCANPEEHATSRAQRKMVKEILKRFFVAVKGRAFIE